MSQDNDCLFCAIVEGKIPSTRMYETEHTYAFADINPRAAVHALVVPKEHYANVSEVAAADPNLLAEMVGVAQKIADDHYNGQYRLEFNTGPDAEQSVFHVHGHVLTGQVLEGE